MTEIDLIIDLHAKQDRQGPGSTNDTLRALELTGLMNNSDLVIADIGCGTGGQTVTLAQHTESQITAVDLFPGFLDALSKRTQALGLDGKINSLEASMEALPFEPESLDVIWSEGAVYNMGFENGVQQWRPYLKQGGHLCVSEITWITQERPKAIEDFWGKEYPEISKASQKISVLEQNDYTLTGYFILPSESWTKSYYVPLEHSFPDFLERHNHSELAKKVVQDYQYEIALYNNYKDYYSYGFYIARKS